jgi:hypothetical protein
MRALLFLPSCLLCLVLFYLPSPSVSESEQNSIPLAQEVQAKMIVVSEGGLDPRELTINKEERVAFFLNNSREDLMSLDVNFGDNTTHCASENLEIGDDGVVSSIKPVAPKDFATMCFYDARTYAFSLQGVGRTSGNMPEPSIVE